jgi:transcriptional regulator NrdR family protein
MKKCHCGRQLADNASQCPNCGKRFTTLTTWILAPLLAVLLVAALF